MIISEYLDKAQQKRGEKSDQCKSHQGEDRRERDDTGTGGEANGHFCKDFFDQNE